MPMSIERPNPLGKRIEVNFAKASQFDAAHIFGFCNAFSSWRKFWFVVQTIDFFEFFLMALSMNRIPSFFDSKQSHNSPVMVTPIIWKFLVEMILARTFGKDDFDFHNGNDLVIV